MSKSDDDQRETNQSHDVIRVFIHKIIDIRFIHSDVVKESFELPESEVMFINSSKGKGGRDLPIALVAKYLTI